ncbi:PTS sugar transporter subunit IIA [Arthrobacter roseus]|uniref:PTS sugar transporter subunit IIA n=1 Tax=Arthrobacter roseus TaxID=136274 RepID=UPI0019653949|nr:PTS system fructose-specific IIA component [Arthrobacter roseus]
MAADADFVDRPLTTSGLVVLRLEAVDRQDAARQLAARMFAEGRLSDLEAFLAQLGAPEHQMATGLPGGIGIPHARSEYVVDTSIAVGVTRFGHSLDFGAVDGPATLILLMATPASSYSGHLDILARLARSLSRENFRESLRRAHDEEIIAELINSTVDFAEC